MANDMAQVPRTIFLIDVNHNASIEHADKKDILLVPQPSNDPRDPLRWSPWKKNRLLVILSVYGLLCGAISGYTASSIAEILPELGLNFNDLANAAAMAVLMAGWGNVFFTPLSNKLGRRFVYILSMVLVISGQAICYTMTNRATYFANMFLSGLGIAPFEALIEVSISDIYFAHERGSKLGIYIASIAIGSFFGPLCGGYVGVNQGWRWIPKWGMILCSILLVVMIFFLDETKFDREFSHRETEFPGQSHIFASDNIEAPCEMDGKKLDASSLAPSPTTGAGESFTPRPYYKSLALWTVFPGTLSQFIGDVVRPFRVMWYPLIFWSGIVYGSCVCWLSVQAVTIASIFAAPPYLFAPDKIGLLALASVVGTIFGSFYSGFLTNHWVLLMTRRNKGIREPEFRLYSLIPGAFFICGGLLMYGLGAAYGVVWVLPAFGSGFLAAGLAVGGTVMMGFIIDCYKEIAPDAITCVIVIRNTMGFAITFGTTDWIQSQGLQNTFITMGILAFAIFMSSVAVIIYGKRLRVMTASSYLSKSKAH